MKFDCNFHLRDGIYVRRAGDKVWLARAIDFDDPGRTLIEMSIDELASVAASVSPNHEQNGSWDYVRDFLANGAMYCGGCGMRLLPGAGSVGVLSYVNRVVCPTCYFEKFKPLFDQILRTKERP